jgi:hypothetical protein
MPVVSVIVNKKILKATFEFQTKIRIKGCRFFLVYKKSPADSGKRQ